MSKEGRNQASYLWDASCSLHVLCGHMGNVMIFFFTNSPLVLCLLEHTTQPLLAAAMLDRNHEAESSA